MKVLLVDDERELVSALAERLGFRGVDAKFASTPDEAIDMVGAETFDLAVLDVKMPGMGGIELRQKVKAIQPDLKVIFLTGHGSANDFKAGCECGAAYLVKPITIDVLLETFDAVLNCK